MRGLARRHAAAVTVMVLAWIVVPALVAIVG